MNTTMPDLPPASANRSAIESFKSLRNYLNTQILGQPKLVESLLIALLGDGHLLVEGPPGLAKTRAIKALAQGLECEFQRVQFTPDLMPGDIVGTEILEEDHETGRKFFKFNKGPLFAHIVLADEINRTPPKTQAALLEAMQEGKVTYAGTDYALPRPFLIIATQNPIEQAGTYPLPEAQLDRFLLYIKLDYPSEQEELDVLKSTTGTSKPTLNTILSDRDILDLQLLTRQVHISDELINAINRLVRSTRPVESQSDFVRQWCEWGAGPRAGQALVLCAKANAVLNARFSVIPDDIRTLAYPILRHRIALNFKAEAAGITPDRVIGELLKSMKV